MATPKFVYGATTLGCVSSTKHLRSGVPPKVLESEMLSLRWWHRCSRNYNHGC